jgi:hypothetical protein
MSDVISGLRTVIQDSLGTDYSRLTHEFHIDKNVFIGASKRWGLVPTSAPQRDGNNRTVTVDLEFEVTLTDEYISSEYEEQALIEKQIEMFGEFEDLWKNLANKKGMVSQHARLIDGFSVERMILMEEEKIIVGYGSFFVKVQIQF